MSKTAVYTPGLKVSRRMRHRARRLLPVSGEVLVGVGERVSARDIVARATLPGDVSVVNLANALSIPPGDVPGAMKLAEGQAVEPGQLVARSQGIFGFFPAEYHARFGGTVETISRVTGQLVVRGAPRHVELQAYLTGEIVEVLPGEGVVIEAEVAYLQGILGIGGEAFGELVLACDSPERTLDAEAITPAMAGKVIVGGARMTGAAVRKAAELGAAAIVSGGLDDADLREILGYDLGVAVTGSERIGTTVILTEGFGDIEMARRSYELLAGFAGQPAAVNGTTQIRAGVMRPEIVIPLGTADAGETVGAESGSGYLEVGTPVRVVRDPYFGRIGSVSALPPEPALLESGSKARVLFVRFDGGEEVMVPRANVERIER